MTSFTFKIPINRDLIFNAISNSRTAKIRQILRRLRFNITHREHTSAPHFRNNLPSATKVLARGRFRTWCSNRWFWLWHLIPLFAFNTRLNWILIPQLLPTLCGFIIQSLKMLLWIPDLSFMKHLIWVVWSVFLIALSYVTFHHFDCLVLFRLIFIIWNGISLQNRDTIIQRTQNRVWSGNSNLCSCRRCSATWTLGYSAFVILILTFVAAIQCCARRS